MTRGLTNAVQTAAAAATVYPILFAYFDMTGGALRVCTANQTVVFGGYNWTGIGDFGKVSPVKEGSTVSANGLSFGLAGIPSSLISEVLTLRSRGRTCTLWLGFYNSSGALQADPFQLWSGRMDQPVVSDSGSESTIEISAESRLIELQRAREQRYTDENQQSLYPGDLGCEFIAALQDKEIIWGKASSTSAVGAPAGAFDSNGYASFDPTIQ